MSEFSMLDRFRGCLLGLAVGDALGAPFETMPAEAIYYGFGFARGIVAAPPVERLEYTDDTQMTIGVAEVLAEFGEIREDALMAAFVRNFEPSRAYGPGTRQLIEFAAGGGDWRALAASIFPGGSLGNGGAMRVAPVGLLFHDDLARVEAEAEKSAAVTHRHPVGVDGARVMSLAVALAVRGGPFDRQAFWDELGSRARTEEFQDAIARAAADVPLGELGVSIEAHRSVVTAVACFASHPDSYADAIGRAIGLGGDTDTVAAMAGALCGARLGVAGIPPQLIERLEDGERGRGYVEVLAGRLCARFDVQGR